MTLQPLQVGTLATMVLTAHDDYLEAMRDALGDPDKAWTPRAAKAHLDEVLACWMGLLGLGLNQVDLALAKAHEYARDRTVAHVAPF
jgi:hypothetical protein